LDIQTVLNTTGNPGDEIEIAGGKGFIYAYYDGAAPAASVAAGYPLMLTYGATVNNKIGPKVKAVASGTIRVVVSLQALTVAGWYWFQWKGDLDDALCTGSNSIVANSSVALAVLNGATVFTYQGATWAAASCAMSRGVANLLGGTSTDIYLPGDMIVVA
jgi:hypothetical protein